MFGLARYPVLAVLPHTQTPVVEQLLRRGEESIDPGKCTGMLYKFDLSCGIFKQDIDCSGDAVSGRCDRAYGYDSFGRHYADK